MDQDKSSPAPVSTEPAPASTPTAASPPPAPDATPSASAPAGATPPAGKKPMGKMMWVVVGVVVLLVVGFVAWWMMK